MSDGMDPARWAEAELAEAGEAIRWATDNAEIRHTGGHHYTPMWDSDEWLHIPAVQRALEWPAWREVNMLRARIVELERENERLNTDYISNTATGESGYTALPSSGRMRSKAMRIKTDLALSVSNDRIVAAIVKAAVEVLNRLVLTDHDAIRDLMNQRVECSAELAELADHPLVQISWIGPGDGERGITGYKLGTIGLLNGIFGKREDGIGLIAAVCDVDESATYPQPITRLYCFERMVDDAGEPIEFVPLCERPIEEQLRWMTQEEIDWRVAKHEEKNDED